MESHSTEIFTTLFNTFWNVFSSKITNADDIKSVVEESFHESQVLDRSRYIFLKSSNNLTNFQRFKNFHADKNKTEVLELWKELSSFDKTKWSNDNGTGEGIPKNVLKNRVSGYNLFVQQNNKVFSSLESGSMKDVSAKWKELTKEQQLEWNTKAHELNEKSTVLVPAKVNKNRTLSGFNLYIRHRTAELKKDNQFTNISKMALEWNTFTAEEKLKWKAL